MQKNVFMVFDVNEENGVGGQLDVFDIFTAQSPEDAARMFVASRKEDWKEENRHGRVAFDRLVAEGKYNADAKFEESDFYMALFLPRVVGVYPMRDEVKVRDVIDDRKYRAQALSDMFDFDRRIEVRL